MTQLWELIRASGIIDLALLGLILLVCNGLGRVALHALGIDPENDLERAVFGVSLGLGAASYLVFFLGCLQLFQPAVFRILLAAATITLAPGWIRSLRAGLKWPRAPFRSLTARVGVGLGVVFATLYLLPALAPETEFDALNYHLGIPRLFITAGGVHHLPHLIYSSFPQNTEMLYVLGWLVHSELLAKLFHFVFALLAAAAVVAFGGRFLNLRVGIWAGVIFLGSPLVGYLAKTAYVDLSLTLYVFLAFYALHVWRTRPEPSWLILAGIFSGLAFGTKYTGLIAAGLIGLLAAGSWLFGALGKGQKRTGRQWATLCLLYSLPLFLLASPWLIKNLVFTGNPLAPFFADLLENPDFRPSDYNFWMEHLRSWRGFEGGWWDYLRGPWLFTWYSNRFGGNPGPVFLLFVPLGVLWGRRDPNVRLLVVCALVGYGVLALGSKLIRFYVPLFPFLSLVIAAGICVPGAGGNSHWLGRLRQGAFGLLVLVLALQLPLFSSLRRSPTRPMLHLDTLRIFTSQQERDRYLEARLRGDGTRELYRFLDESIPRGGAALTVTPGYQALLDRPLYMVPNSSAANDLTYQILDASLEAAGLSLVELTLAQRARYRLWRIALPDRALSGWKSYRPRVFDREGDRMVERFVHSTRAVASDGSSLLEIDLGAPRWVSEIRFREDLGEDPLGQAGRISFRAHDGAGWIDVPVKSHLRPSTVRSPGDLAKSLGSYRITHVFFNAELPNLEFLEEFFELPQVRVFFGLAYDRGDFRVYQVKAME